MTDDINLLEQKRKKVELRVAKIGEKEKNTS